MASKVWLVTRVRHTTDNDSMVILGIYDNESDAIGRVNEEFPETEDEFIEEWGEDYDGVNHFNGYAECHTTLDDAWDKCEIKVTEYEINKPTFDSI